MIQVKLQKELRKKIEKKYKELQELFDVNIFTAENLL